MRKFKTLLSLSLAGIINSTAVHAGSITLADTNVTLSYEVSAEDSSINITGCNADASGDFTIPGSIEGLPVRSIADYAFQNCVLISEVGLPVSMQSIGTHAFEGCDALSEVEIPASVTGIPDYAFADCDNLGQVSLSEGLVSIGAHAFKNCSSLWSISMPDSVVSIGNNAFYGDELLHEVILSANLESIGNWSFSACPWLEKLELPESLLFIGNYAFKDSPNAFNFGGGSPTNLRFPHDLYYIGAYAFEGCSIDSITISPKVITIGDSAFAGSGASSALFQGDAPDNFGSGVFDTGDDEDDPCIVKFYEQSTGFTEGTWEGYPSLMFDGDRDDDGLMDYWERFYGGDNSLSRYSADGDHDGDGVSDLDEFVQDTHPSVCNAVSIGFFKNSAAIVACDSDYTGEVLITATVFGKPVVSVEAEAFKDSQASSIVLPYNIESIGASAFEGSQVESLAIPYGVTSIGAAAFRGSQLSSISLPDALEELGANAFQNCTSLSEIELPTHLSVVETSSFQGCAALQRVKFGHFTSEIGSYAFQGCSSLSELEINWNTRTVGVYAFSECTGLESVMIRGPLELLAAYAFSGCSELSEAFFGSSTPSTFATTAFNGAASDFVVRFYEGSSGFTDGTWEGYPSEAVVLVIDEDGDGISDEWELQHFDNLSEADASSDYDSDGVTDLDEYVGNTQPRLHNAVSYEVVGESVTITDCETDVSVSLRIPAEIEEKPVTEIGYAAFSGCADLPYLYLPDSVTSIGVNAFKNCTELNMDRLGDHIESIGSGAFSGCSSLRMIDWREGETYGTTYIPPLVTTIGVQTFMGCSSITELSGATGVTSISISAFADCERLSSIKLPDGIEMIDEYAFSNTALESLLIPAGVYVFDPLALDGCEDLRDIAVEAESNYFVTVDGVLYNAAMTQLMRYPPKMTGSEYVLPTSVTEIHEGAFDSCEILQKVQIHADVASLTGKLFRGWRSAQEVEVAEAHPDYASVEGVLYSKDLTSLVYYPAGAGVPDYSIREGVESIGESAFLGSDVVFITIPESVTEIRYEAFRYSSSLSRVFFNGDAPAGVGQYMLDDVDEGLTIYYYDDSTGFDTSYWQAFTMWVLDSDSDEDGIDDRWEAEYFEDLHVANAVSDYDMDGSTDLEEYLADTNPLEYPLSDLYEYEITDGYAVITSADQQVSGEVIVPAMIGTTPVRRIGNNAFQYCSLITSVVIPDTVTYIENYAFADCTQLEEVSVGKGLAFVGENAFDGCYNLLKVDLSKGVIAIGQYAFEGCEKLNEVSFSNSLMSIGDCAFMNCHDLESVVLPRSLTSLGTCAFLSCSSLTRVVFEGDVPGTLGSLLFDYADSSFVVQFYSEDGGFTAPEWQGYPSEYVDPDSDDDGIYDSHEIELFGDLDTAGASTDYDGDGKSDQEEFSNKTNPLVNDHLEYRVDGDVVSITGCARELSGAFTIPSTIDGKPVQIIERRAFSDCYELTEVVIPKGVTTIGPEAFYGLSKLVAVEIPESVSVIGKRAFLNCGLESVVFWTDVAIGDEAFAGCSSLKRAQFEYDVPSSFGTDVFAEAHADFSVYYNEGALGFTEPEWEGYPSEMTDGDYLDWRDAGLPIADMGSADVVPEADPDGDGLSNYEEYILCSDPMGEASSSNRAEVQEDVDELYVDYPFSVRERVQCVYILEISYNLRNWTDVVSYQTKGTGVPIDRVGIASGDQASTQVEAVESEDGTWRVVERVPITDEVYFLRVRILY